MKLKSMSGCCNMIILKKAGLLTIILALFITNGYTQNSFESIDQKLDQYFEYSTKLNKEPDDNTRASISKHKDTHLEIDDKMVVFFLSKKDSMHFPKIISKISSITDTTYDPRVLTAAYYLYEEFMLCDAVDIKLKRKMVEWILKHSECIYTNIFYGINDLTSPKYFIKKAKKRIRQLLTADTLKLSQKAIKVKRLKEIQRLKIHTDTLPYFYKKYKADSSNLPYHQWVDSTQNEEEFKAYKKDSTDKAYLQWKKQYYISKLGKKDYNDYTIPKLPIISTIANADLQEFAPVLEKMYNNGEYQNWIRLALAKFRYKDFAEKALNYIKKQVKKDNRDGIDDYEEDLYYIGTQEAFAYYGEFLKTDMKRDCQKYSDFNDKRKNYGYYVLYKLSIKIKNMPVQKYKEKYYDENTDKDQKLVIGMSFCKVIPYYPDNILDKMYRWMKENKGNYEIREYERMLPITAF